MKTHTPLELLSVALESATLGAAHAVAERARNQDANLIARNDIKLKLDVECQQIITDNILRHFPAHVVLGEEDTEEHAAPADVCEWIIDPIDGTVNFFHGSPFWCSSVAVRLNGETLAGCVCAPDMNMTYTASADTDAQCNGKPIRVSTIDDMQLAIFHTGADKSDDPAKHPYRFFNAIAQHVQRPRICGAAALDICLTAAGMSEAYFEPGIFIWDIAAADLILHRAGGTGTILRDFGKHRLAYLGSNGLMHAHMVNMLDPLF